MTEILGTDNGRAAPQHTGAFLTSGVLLLLYGLVPAAWTAYTLIVRETPIGDFLLALVWPSRETHVMAMTPYEWAFSVALVVVGILALTRRRVARGGALMFSFALLAVSVREAVGLLDDAYRAEYLHSGEGPWLLATRVSGLVIGVVVLTLMLRATDDRDQPPGPSLLVVAGVVMTVVGAVSAAAVLVQPEGAQDYLGAIFDPTGTGPSSMYGSLVFYHATITVTLLAGGVLAILRRRVARGVGLALAPVAAYAALHGVVPLLENLPLDLVFDTVEGSLYVGSELLTVAAVVAVPLLAVAGRRSDPAGLAPLPGDVGQQHPGGH